MPIDFHRIGAYPRQRFHYLPSAACRLLTATLTARIIVSFVVSFLVFPVAAQGPPENDDRMIRESLQRIAAVFEAASSHSASPVEPQQLIYHGAIPGLLSRLDPFSVFLDADQFHTMQQQSRGVRQGFGAILNVQSGKITVLHSVPDSPFSRAGIGPGDRIVGVNSYRVATLTLEEIVQHLQQARSGKVLLSVLQAGNVVPRDFELDPTEVASPTIDQKFQIASGVGFIHLSRIDPSTPAEIRETLDDWDAGSLRALILDLRDNPGGSLQAAVATLALFLPQGAQVVSLLGRAVPEQIYTVETVPPYPDLPLVLILNSQSASAAEIIAAALQEHDRAWLVGEGTFGKGVAESVLPLSEGTALVLTTARYFTPLGRSVQKPLPDTALAGILGDGSERFFTGQNREITQQGGIVPDQVSQPWQLDPWMELLLQSTAFLNFAQAYMERHGRVGRDFVVTTEVMDEFREFLLRSGFVVSERQWAAGLALVESRVQAEILTLVYGITAGDQADAEADPQVNAAVAAIADAERLLRGMLPKRVAK